MVEFEKVRDEVELRIKQALRNNHIRAGLSDASTFSRKDLGIKALGEVYNGYDHGATDAEIQRVIEKVAGSVEAQRSSKEREADKWIQRFTSQGYYGSLKLLRKLGIHVKGLEINKWNHLQFNPLLKLINPGGRVHIKEGKYSITASLSLPASAILLEGDGWGDSPDFSGTCLSLANGVNAPVLKCKDNVLKEFMVLRDFFVDGNDAGQTVAVPAVDLKLHDSLIDNVIVLYSIGSGMRFLSGSSFTTLRKVFIEETGAVGACLEYPSYSVNMDHYSCVFMGGLIGVSVEAGADFDFVSCFSEVNDADGYRFSNNAKRMRVFGGAVYLNLQNGFLFEGCSQSLLSGVSIFANSQQTTNVYDAIQLNSFAAFHSVYNTIMGCYIMDDAKVHRYGVNEVNANQDYNLLLANQIRGTGTGKIRLQGAHSSDSHNMV